MVKSFDGKLFDSIENYNAYKEMYLAELRDISSRYRILEELLSCGECSYYGGYIEGYLNGKLVETDVVGDIDFMFNIEDSLHHVCEYRINIHKKIKRIEEYIPEEAKED